MKNTLPELGVGITYSPAIEPILLDFPNLVDVLEVEPQTFWVETGNKAEPFKVSTQILEHINQLPGRKLVHSIGAPVGGSVHINPVQYRLLREAIEIFDSPWISDHLSFNSTPEFYTGFFLPPRQTLEGVKTVVKSIQRFQREIDTPLAVETGVNYLQPRVDEMPDGVFVAEVIESANCGLLLDLHNIFANSMNGRQNISEYLSQIPLERVWEIHIAGGLEMDGFWLDAHSGPIPEPLFEVAKQLIPLLPNLKAIVFEIFPSFVEIVGNDVIATQIQSLKELWGLKNSPPLHPPQRNGLLSTAQIRNNNVASPEIWETSLAKLVTGQYLNSSLSYELASDPAISLVNKLIKEFRASMIVSTLRYSSRLLMLSLGADVFRALLENFWSKFPPNQYASSEANAFAKYLAEEIQLKVPHLAKILEFEQAVIATLIDGRTRMVSFKYDPIILLQALAKGELPSDFSQEGVYEIELTADGPVNISGLNKESLQQFFRFH